MIEASDVFFVLVTVPNRAVGRRLARDLVTDRLAACVNILDGVTSVYRWEDRVQEDAEEMLLIKTTEARLEQVQARVQEGHPYDVPEVVTLPLSRGSEAYVQWLRAACRVPGE